MRTYEVELMSRIFLNIEADSEEEAIDKAVKEANDSFEVWHNYEFTGYIDTEDDEE